MCLAIPGKVVDTYDQRGLLMAKVQFGGIVREATKHVKSNQGRERVQGREDNYYLEIGSTFFVEQRPTEDV